jgi:tripartite-type tricarboxylate transporter receptor subunit TctC
VVEAGRLCEKGASDAELHPERLVVGAVLAVFTAVAAGDGYAFFEGKTIRMVVGFSAGGGFDAYSRALARHLPKHIPGNPAIIVENMTGAGSLIAANHVYKVAKPDGLAIGHFIGGLFLTQLLDGPGVAFDAPKI